MLADPALHDLFVCPACHDRLVVEETPEPILRCRRCNGRYPVRAGIPRFVSSDNYAASFGEQWNRHRRTQLDSYTGVPVSRQRVAATTGWPPRLDHERVLEAGSGAGRFTEVLLTTGAHVHSFDYSTAVDANHANNHGHGNLTLFQASIYAIPLPPGTFDRVICIGVLQHTPDPEQAFHSLAAQVRAGGQLVVDLYPKRLSALLSWKYVLRPVTKRMDRQRLHRLVERAVDALLPAATWLRRRAGRAGARLLPIVEYSHLGLAPDVNREWAVLDTFDMYSPAHDHPQTEQAVRRWYARAGFVDVHVAPGPNGIIGRGRRPEAAGPGRG
jgi:2-polyprenyl-3-methyl-5-hydroxy-6-metoxy-1,4-benzoquinol methylase